MSYEEKETSVFGHRIYSIREIASESGMRPVLNRTMSLLLSHIGIPERKRASFFNEFIKIATNYNSLPAYERDSRKLFEKYGIVGKLNSALSNRSKVTADQVLPFVKGSVLDLGCGDGKVGLHISHAGHSVTLADVFEHPNIKKTGLDFVRINQGSLTPFFQHDTTLLLTVMHHSDNPMGTLRNAINATKKGGRIVVIESVHSLKPEELGKIPLDKNSKYYLSLPHSKQLKSLQFFDHMWNRILNYHPQASKKINVPQNHATVTQWMYFARNNGLSVEKVVHLAIDQPTSPEWHVMFVLRRN